MTSLHDEVHRYTESEDTARSFLTSRGILKSTMTCSCGTQMNSIPCPETKSADLFTWKCPACKKFKNIRSESILSGKKITFKSLILLVFYFSIRSVTNLDIAALTGLSDKTVGEWRKVVMNAVSTWFLSNSTPIGGPGKIVEVDEAKFGKRKFNRGAYREGIWVLGGVDRETGQCFLAPCPNNKRDGATLIPLINNWILPGSIVYTDEWQGYNTLVAKGYTHDSVNHSIQFVDPQTGVHTNTQEGLWHHVKRQMTGCKNIEDVLIDFMFRRRFNACSGITQIPNAFNGYINALRS